MGNMSMDRAGDIHPCNRGPNFPFPRAAAQPGRRSRGRLTGQRPSGPGLGKPQAQDKTSRQVVTIERGRLLIYVANETMADRMRASWKKHGPPELERRLALSVVCPPEGAPGVGKLADAR